MDTPTTPPPVSKASQADWVAEREKRPDEANAERMQVSDKYMTGDKSDLLFDDVKAAKVKLAPQPASEDGARKRGEGDKFVDQKPAIESDGILETFNINGSINIYKYGNQYQDFRVKVFTIMPDGQVLGEKISDNPVINPPVSPKFVKVTRQES